MRYFVFVMFLLCFCSVANAKEVELHLNEEFVPANSYLAEVFDIGELKESGKLPKRIVATVTLDDWVYNLPHVVGLTDWYYTQDTRLTEGWDVFFARVHGGRILFIRTLTNNTDEDLYSYAWDVKINYRLKSK